MTRLLSRLLSRRALAITQAALLAAASSGAWAQANPAQGNAASGKLALAKPAAARPAAAAPVAIEWPTKPIRLLIGFPPGSVQDLSARSISEQLSKTLGQPVIVENKAGASGIIAADQVSKATDMHTFGVMNNSQLTIAKLLNPMAPYDPAVDLAPIALIGTTPMVMVVSNFAQGNTPQEWLTWLRNQGDKANYGSPGAGTPGHLGMELIKSRSGGLGVMHVPYPGNPQIITAMLGGQLQAALLPPGLAMQQVKAGKMKVIGVTSEQRSMLAPELPTLREVGIMGADMELFTALAGPASLPAAVRDKLGAAVIEALKTGDTRQRLITVGWQPAPSTAEGLRTRMRADTRNLGGIIMLRGIRADS
ncbi:tripartite tricarboxylate transporter substrate binding protein [Polaromonas sp. JS666]|uniref:Bug family tripartite tricarboxylate transporter substrate binding protein n=1 Tax=Polaromonas sp. (strain JS666 / ATCC BAA-500) TaxID=296591 RepID=UPI000882ABE2|nr:tripartite tricarboxylate transporter substrate binding protein [Polaromonas sp. JS666]SDM39248.1 Tripartite-type tricarboxylate transporter, receptor component TctC [Polaromonas sp. JS666]